MSNAPTVTVILTTFNQGRWLKEAIESVLSQTFDDWELMIVDNGSTDESPRIIGSYAQHPKVTAIRYEQNTPHTIINNEAIRQARGRYVSLLCGDDYYLPRKLELQVAEFEKLTEKYGVVYCGGYRLVPDGRLVELPCGTCAGDILETLLRSASVQQFPPIAPLVRRECLLRYPFNEAVFIEGEAVYGKIALGYHFAPVFEPLVVMRDHENNLGKEISSNLERNVLMLNELFDHPEFPVRFQHLRGRLLAKAFSLGGWQAIRRDRDYQLGREHLRRAIGHDPSVSRNPRVRTGMALCGLPRWMANACQWAVNRWKGIPPPGIGNPTPVTGIVRPAGSAATNPGSRSS